MPKDMDDSALQDLIKGIATNAKKKNRIVKKSASQEQDSEKKQVRKVVKKKEGKKYIVVFQDAEGKVLKTTFVEEGKNATAPSMPEIKEELEHHRILFKGWDHSGENVRSNLVIRPIYQEEAKQYLIMYLDERGKILGTEKVFYGQAAVSDFHLEKESTAEFQYTFLGWNQSLDFVEKDMTVKPIFAPMKRKYDIVFRGDKNRILEIQSVKYGELPKAPNHASKAEDEVYTYKFSGWNREIEPVVSAAEYRAIFQSIYKEYLFQAYLEEEKIFEKEYHYGDLPEYPMPNKKGYDLIWDIPCSEIRGNLTIHGAWDFANKKGKLLESKLGCFRILNPSIQGGCVSLVQYYGKESKISIPEKIKLGDYYYKIIKIEKKAFSQCKNAKEILLGNLIEEVEERGFGGCQSLKKITFGKNVKIIGKQAFYGTKHLSQIRFKGSKLKRISPQAFDQMSGKVKVKADNILPFQLEKIFARGISKGSVLIDTF